MADEDRSIADALRALMEADRWIDRVEGQRTHLPELAELGEVELRLRHQLDLLHDAEAVRAPVQAEYDRVASESGRLRERAAKLDAALQASTAGTKELTALEGELAHVRELLAASEDRELELLVALEEHDIAIASIREAARPDAARRDELRGQIEALQSSLDDELADLRRQRAERAESVPEPWRRRYDHAFVRSGGSGAAQVVDGRCDGCRIALAAADLDRWRHEPEGEFFECPECGRLLLP